MTDALPQSPDDLTPVWLTDRLRETKALPAGSSVTTVDQKVIGTEFGFTSTVVRLGLGLHGDAGDLPASIVAKMASPATIAATGFTADDHVRQMILSRCTREASFFTDLAPTVSTRVPRCFGVWSDADAQTCVLLLEDIHGLQGDAVIGATTAQTRTLLTEIAGLHAANWADRCPTFDWLPARDPDPVALDTRFRDCRPVFMERFADRLTTDEQAVITALDPAAVLAQLQDRPETVIHADLHLDNVVFDRENRPVILDWQSVARGHAAIDVAFLVTEPPRAEDQPSDVHGRLHDLTSAWHAAVNIDGYTFDDATSDVRLGMKRLLAGVVVGFSHLDPATCAGRERDLLEAYFERGLLLKSLTG